jgi:hypothetical protein
MFRSIHLLKAGKVVNMFNRQLVMVVSGGAGGMFKSQGVRWKNDIQPLCPHCENIELRRQGRVGIWQRVILPWFGLFPWECGLCRRIYMVRQRSGGYGSTGGYSFSSAPAPKATPPPKPPQAPSSRRLRAEDVPAEVKRASGTPGISSQHRR